ncbi:MAG: outer membrane lipoprotein chaperone LolA, partial [Gammaproteobacteria bacterium]
AFLDDFNSLESNFIQQLINEDGEVLEKSEGVLKLQQPGKFNWSYEAPYAQKIISNGEVLWLFDEDLEQLTIRKIGNTLDETPAGIILGNNDINEHFVQVGLGVIDGYDWIELTPKNIETQYKNIRIGFNGSQLGMMMIVDNLGQTTRIDFLNVKKNVDLQLSSFELETPAGVDVIDERYVDETPEINP